MGVRVRLGVRREVAGAKRRTTEKRVWDTGRTVISLHTYLLGFPMDAIQERLIPCNRLM